MNALPQDPQASVPFDHVTVLLEETVDAVLARTDVAAEGSVDEDRAFADLTLGGGGHSARLLEKAAPTDQLWGVDRDPVALAAAKERLAPFGPRVTFVHSAFGDFPTHAQVEGLGPFDGLIADIGVSSPQLDDGSRGFSFRFDGPLDMRMDRTQGLSARDYIASLSEQELADVIYRYGEERRSRPIARSIKRAEAEGQLETTGDLAHAVRRVFGGKRGRIDPATRTFQGLRIAVNDELGQLEQLLERAPDILKEGGRLAVISFHSLEDRMVKRAFRDDPRWAPLTKKPVVAGEEELAANPRARTAKLRVAARVTPTDDARRAQPAAPDLPGGW